MVLARAHTHTHTHTFQWNGTESPEISPGLHNQLLSNTGGKNIHWGKDTETKDFFDLVLLILPKGIDMEGFTQLDHNCYLADINWTI